MAHRQEFQDALFDFFQSVMIVFQNALRFAGVADFAAALFPRHRQQPVDVAAADGGFGRHGRHHFQPFQLLQGFFLYGLGHAAGFDLFLQLVQFALFAPAQLLLDGLHFFIQIELFLRLLHLPFDLRLDATIHVELFHLELEQVAQPFQALKRIEQLQ